MAAIKLRKQNVMYRRQQRSINKMRYKMANLKGRKGKAILEELRSMPPVSEEQRNELRQAAFECMKRLNDGKNGINGKNIDKGYK